MAAIGNFEAIIFESCVSNFNKISFFLFAPAMANFVDFTPLRINSYCGEQYAEPHPHALTTQRGTHYNKYVTILPDHYSTSVPGSDLCEGGILKAFVTLAPGLKR
jgi:hypothetical protein